MDLSVSPEIPAIPLTLPTHLSLSLFLSRRISLSLPTYLSLSPYVSLALALDTALSLSLYVSLFRYTVALSLSPPYLHVWDRHRIRVTKQADTMLR